MTKPCLYLILCSYIGHVKERTVKEQMVRDSTEVLRKAVHRMLPRNKLRDVSYFLLKDSFSCPCISCGASIPILLAFFFPVTETFPLWCLYTKGKDSAMVYMLWCACYMVVTCILDRC